MHFLRKKPSKPVEHKLAYLLDKDGRLDADKLTLDHNFSLGGISLFVTGFGGRIQFGTTYFNGEKQKHTLCAVGFTLLGKKFAKVKTEVVFNDSDHARGAAAELCLTDDEITSQTDPTMLSFIIFDPTRWFRNQLKEVLASEEQIAKQPIIVFVLRKPIFFREVDTFETDSRFGYTRRCEVSALSVEYGYHRKI